LRFAISVDVAARLEHDRDAAVSQAQRRDRDRDAHASSVAVADNVTVRHDGALFHGSRGVYGAAACRYERSRGGMRERRGRWRMIGVVTDMRCLRVFARSRSL